MWVYSFGDGGAEGSARMRELLGGKGADLAEMSNLGVPVPPGFTITTDICTYFFAHGQNYPDGLSHQVDTAMGVLENTTGAGFGDTANPLLVSVRSGAPVSMPGMMDTVLDLGLNDGTVEGLARQNDDPRFAYDSYRRFIQMYSDVVLGIDHHRFEELLESCKQKHSFTLDTELGADDWKQLIAAYKAKVEEELGQPFPQDVDAQLWGAIGAVFGSWMNQSLGAGYQPIGALPHRRAPTSFCRYSDPPIRTPPPCWPDAHRENGTRRTRPCRSRSIRPPSVGHSATPMGRKRCPRRSTKSAI